MTTLSLPPTELLIVRLSRYDGLMLRLCKFTLANGIHPSRGDARHWLHFRRYELPGTPFVLTANREIDFGGEKEDRGYYSLSVLSPSHRIVYLRWQLAVDVRGERTTLGTADPKGHPFFISDTFLAYLATVTDAIEAREQSVGESMATAQENQNERIARLMREGAKLK